MTGAPRLIGALCEYCVVFNQYRKHHPWRYAARVAYEIAFLGASF